MQQAVTELSELPQFSPVEYPFPPSDSKFQTTVKKRKKVQELMGRL